MHPVPCRSAVPAASASSATRLSPTVSSSTSAMLVKDELALEASRGSAASTLGAVFFAESWPSWKWASTSAAINAFGHGNIDLLRGLVDLTAGFLPCSILLESAHAAINVSAQFVDRVELRGHRDELLRRGSAVHARGPRRRSTVTVSGHPGPVSVAAE